METTAPIKRHKQIQPFSREHHFGLLLSWKIQQGMRLNVSLERIWNYVDWFWQTILSNHFEQEQDYLFRYLPPHQDNTKKLVAHRRKIKRLFKNKPKDIKTLNCIEEELERLIRFEERVILNELQQILTEKELNLLATLHFHTTEEEWHDKFWE